MKIAVAVITSVLMLVFLPAAALTYFGPDEWSDTLRMWVLSFAIAILIAALCAIPVAVWAWAA